MKEKIRLMKLSGILNEVEIDVIKNSYAGIEIPYESIKKYDDKLRGLLGDSYEQYKANKERRDGAGEYHMTIISPPEFGVLRKTKKDNEIPSSLMGNPKMIGVGAAKKGEDEAYYVVIDFPEANELRKSLGFEPKDFHVTLAFKNKDVHGVPKDSTTLID